MNKKVILLKRPKGIPQDDDFAIIEEPIKANFNDGEVLVKVKWISIDPAQRVWIAGSRSYIEPISIGSVVKGLGVGQVIISKTPLLKRGNYVAGFLHCQEFCKISASELWKLPSYENPQLYLGVLGITGLSAFFAIEELAKPNRRDTIVISTAAGATGSIACQLAKLRGARVIGIAGSDDKCEYLRNELKIDAAINYKTTRSINSALRELCPDGIDIYLDNVGGEILDAVLLNIKKHGKIIACGAIASYNSKRPKPIHNYPLIISLSLTVEGFIVWDYKNRFQLATRQLSRLVQEKQLTYKEHILEGIKKVPEALRLLMTGENQGKMIVKLQHSDPHL